MVLLNSMYKKFLNIFILVTLNLFVSNVNASSIEAKKIYCPPVITCSTEGELASCSYKSDEPQFWAFITAWGSLNAGEYSFFRVFSAFHPSSIGKYQTKCQYQLKSDPESQLTLIPKKESNIDAYIDNKTKWITDDEEASCVSDGYAKDCPLKEAFSLAVFNYAISEPDALFVSANDKRVFLVFDLRPDRDWDLMPGKSILYDDILQACGSKASECKLDFSTNLLGDIGSVILNIDNGMRIVRIIPNLDSGINIERIGSFNSIEINKSNQPLKASIIVHNRLHSFISLFVNGNQITDHLPSSAKMVVQFKQLAPMCAGLQKCKIDVGLGDSISSHLGTITIDMQKEMKVIEVDADKPSEIDVEKAEDHLVNVRYPCLS